DTLLNLQKSAPTIDDNLSGEASPSDTIIQSVDINTKSTYYVGATSASVKDQPKVNSNFRHLVADPVFDGVNIFIPHKVFEKVSTRFEHTLYGYFIGKRMAFPVVEYYAKNNWAKHGLKRIMINSKGFFFFKFNSHAGLEAVLKGGPWLILFEEDGISLISTFIGKPVMLDSYTSSMCNDSWGRSSFAQCLIEVNSKADFVDVVTIGIPSLTGDVFTKETIMLSMNEGRPCSIDDFQMVGKKKNKKGKFKSTNGAESEYVVVSDCCAQVLWMRTQLTDYGFFYDK
nr:zinc knuckle CX2CX4HX4C [Tanacetum cinerariifolium]